MLIQSFKVNSKQLIPFQICFYSRPVPLLSDVNSDVISDVTQWNIERIENLTGNPSMHSNKPFHQGASSSFQRTRSNSFSRDLCGFWMKRSHDSPIRNLKPRSQTIQGKLKVWAEVSIVCITLRHSSDQVKGRKVQPRVQSGISRSLGIEL